MDAVRRLLVRPQDNLLLLLTPPFDRTPRDPGYIKGYPPGIRENGGQYTHAALWSAWAFAELGQSETAEGVFRLLNPIYLGLAGILGLHREGAALRIEPHIPAGWPGYEVTYCRVFISLSCIGRRGSGASSALLWQRYWTPDGLD